MAVITDYDSLKTAIDDFMARSDLTTFTPNFIEEGEERIYNEMRTSDMEVALSSTISSGVISVPSTYIEMKQAYIDGSPTAPLRRVSLPELYQRYPTRSSDAKPCVFAREGSNFIFGPYPDSGYTVKGTYYSRLANLSAGNTTNWLTDKYPYLILSAALVNGFQFIMDEQRAMFWEQKFQDHKKQIELLEKREAGSGSVLRARAV